MQRKAIIWGWILSLSFLTSVPTHAQTGNLVGTIERPLRYRPVGTDFVIENGREFFNRPLYGGNTAFRVDAGDKPEFMLYLPGRGGNLRFGIKTRNKNRWLHEADKIVARYRPGSMLYEVRDPLLGKGVLKLTVLAMYQQEGLLARVELEGADGPVELVWAYGGVNRVRGRRDGDIGTESVPISQYFQFKPEFARENKFRIEGDEFTLESKAARIVGVGPKGATLVVADGNKWSNLEELLVSSESDEPVVVGRKTLENEQDNFIALLTAETQREALAGIFQAAEKYRQSIVAKVVVETPDSFINAAAAALNVGADGVWDEAQGAFMHGSVAWRTKLLGWRGPYLGDALGWHDRMRRHLEYWATRQNTKPISNSPVKPDPSSNYARNEPELHTNGDISNSHYDMNIVYIDALFRHLLWTGDVELARKLFPVIKRHLAWEQRLFRREYGPEKLPLYEAYVAIWASDDLQYHGSGVTHTTAYNYYHNKMAARVARLIGEDPVPYEREAELIYEAMRKHLWLQKGWFGEYKDLLGLQRVHENAAVWTFYHSVDSEVTTPEEAWQMSRFIDTQIPHIPIRGENVPQGELQTISTTSWMPYTWSTNNVVMSEVMHTALAYWQSGRPDEAFKLYKAAILDSMFMGICPGNVGSMTYLDAYRRESQRDFADPAGTNSRAMIEGLFGIRPDGLAEELTIKPGFPADWNFAKLNHHDLNFSFNQNGLIDTYLIESKFPKQLALRLQVAALRDQIESVKVNGKKVEWTTNEDSIGQPVIEIAGRKAPQYKVEIVWKGNKLSQVEAPQIVAENSRVEVGFGKARLIEVFDPQRALQGVEQGSNSLTGTATANFGHRTVFAKVKQGAMSWQVPVMFEIRPAFEILAKENQEADSIGFRVRNNTRQPVDKLLDVFVNGQSEKVRLKVPAWGESREIVLASAIVRDDKLRHVGHAGSNFVAIDFGNGRTVRGVVQNWKMKNEAKFETVDLASIFNEKVTNIFKHEYLSPRSPYVSLAIPKQGIGSWARFDEVFEVDDTGLRQTADRNGGRLILPNGVSFQTVGPGSARNIAFTSQWDNFPREISVPVSGKSSHVYLLMAGSTNQMQSRIENGEVVVTYTDNSTEKLSLTNPTTWWPIDQDYMIDDYAFRRPETIPPRVDLKTGNVRILEPANFKGKGRKVPGGAATVLDLPLDANKSLKSLTVRSLANEVVIGLMAATLVR